MRLEFKGVVTTGDCCRCSEDPDMQYGCAYIGGRDLVDEIAEEKWSDNVRVSLNGEDLANGTVVTGIGWGYSEYTPVDSDVAKVGECDLLDRLIALEGQEVHLIIEDVAE
jgi:hypothetical protein